MPLSVRISNLNKKRKISRALVRKSASSVLASFGKKKALIDITFVSDTKIKALNKKYMGRRRATDVLSFVFGPSPLPEKGTLIGDIYISSDRAADNAKRFRTGFREEILLYTVHGVLHLLGLGDKTAKEKKRIRQLENKFLSSLRGCRRQPKQSQV